MSSIKATWKCIARHADLQRSSHIVSTIDHRVYIFGGELQPRQPRDNNLYAIDLRDKVIGIDPQVVTVSVDQSTPAPSPRVGSASTTLKDAIYLFSGRGGPSMAPIDEHGGLWCYNTTRNAWSFIEPADPGSAYPEARSYHCMASDGVSSVFVHAGCLASGRLRDLWRFDIPARRWENLADAPAPPRGGTSVVYIGGQIWRMGGFDGKSEVGGKVDVFDVESERWETKTFEEGPGARSVAGLTTAKVGSREVLVVLFGEGRPSALGHEGAGRMWGDWWVYDINAGKWTEGRSEGEMPPARGWFDADNFGEGKIVVVGGLSEENKRLEDVWVLDFD